MGTLTLHIFTFIWVILFGSTVETSRILVVNPKAQKSHASVFEGISTALAEAGHNITLVTPHEFKHDLPNMEIVLLTGVLEKYTEASKKKNLEIMKMSPIQTLTAVSKSATLDTALTDPNLRKLMNTRTFDLVIIEMFSTEAYVGLGQHFGVPVIFVSTYSASVQTNVLVGNPTSLSYIPHALTKSSPKMGLIKRIGNVVLETYEKIMLSTVNIPLQVKITVCIISCVCCKD